MDNKLNQFGVATTSFAAKSGAVNSYQFDNQFERDAITLTKIRNFSFSAGTGGTIVLGGSNNGNGLMLVKDGGGTTRVTINNQGINVTDGRITVTNTAGETLVDSTGLVSTTNFPNDAAFNGTANLSTSSTSFVDVPASTLGSFVVTRTTRVLINMMGFGYNENTISSNGADQVELQIYDSYLGTDATNIFVGGLNTTNVEIVGGTSTVFTLSTNNQLVARADIIDAEPGTHIYKLQYRAFGGGVAHLNAWSINYVILGA